jgi:hypothetical protein
VERRVHAMDGRGAVHRRGRQGRGPSNIPLIPLQYPSKYPSNTLPTCLYTLLIPLQHSHNTPQIMLATSCDVI